MGLEEYKGVYTCAQQTDGQLSRIGLELFRKTRELMETLDTSAAAVLIGSEVEELVGQLAECRAGEVIIVDDPTLREYITEPYAQVLAGVIKAYKPGIMLVGATPIGRDLNPRASARMATGLTTGCTGLEISDLPLNPVTGRGQKHNQLLMTRPAFSRDTIVTIACPGHRPQMATVRPGIMQAIAPVKGIEAEMTEYDLDTIPSHNYVEIMDIVREAVEAKDIMDARVLISGERGMDRPESFRILEELTSALGGQISRSRAVVDAGWKPKDLQVGQIGKTVRPSLYIVVSISGVIQHVAGMEEFDVIIAINKDENAPIFEVANYGVVGGWRKVAPELAKQIQL